MSIYYVRHGETNYNLKNLCNDDPTKKVHLTQQGKEQGREVKRRLKSVIIDVVVVTELPRTGETAAIIVDIDAVEYRVEARLNDRRTGYDSRPESEFLAAIASDPFNSKPEGGESFQEEKQRVITYIKELDEEARQTKKNYLVVTHSEVIKIVNGHYKGLSDQEMWETEIDNCQILEMNL